MKFDGNRAWNDAIRAVSANREVLLVMAGVFFFLPGLIAAVFLAGYQADMAASMSAVMAAPKNPVALQQMIHAYGQVAPFFIVLLLLQLVGYMAMLALLTDDRRPTVGEAMAIGARSMPALIGAILIFVLGYFLVSLPMGLVLVLCVAALGPQLGGTIGITIDMAVLIVIFIRLSLTLPVIVIDRLHRPFVALQRSWQITRGHTLRLIAFYVMLGIAYIVLSIAFNAMLNLLLAAVGTGTGFDLISGTISGVFGAAASIVFTAILAAVHRQLSGPWRGAISENFL
ncbi:MAG: glycerophosphoryl diester phosphodiesterase membrane domain-containing protein [Pseudomonadota bacterium]|nr:glycerophosphoryl diester phosphodiesterase membrane domain-containing protein [Pseudomonadota bacterium]